MGMTMTEKILAEHAGIDSCKPGDILTIDLDLVLGNELSTIVAIKEFERIKNAKVLHPDRIVIVPDHFTPNKDITTAKLTQTVREFVKKHKIENYFEVGRGGIEHVILPDHGFVRPGMTIIGGDSHTCTYGALNAFATGVGSTDMAAAFITGKVWVKVPESIKIVYTGKLKPWVSAKDLILYAIGKLGVDGARYKSVEFVGRAIRELPAVGRLTMVNMTIEMGGKNGIMEADDKTEEFLKSRTNKPYTVCRADEDARYSDVLAVDCDEVELQVAFPSLPSNTRSISKARGVKMDQVLLGSCTNGRIEDLRIAAHILKGRKIHPSVRMIVLPGSQEIAAQAAREGVYQILLEAGALISPSTCGACVGGHAGVLGEGERCLSTTNRNFVGRMGAKNAEIYLSSPAVAAATALTGEITSPEDVADFAELAV